jgi:hypothetical protein
MAMRVINFLKMVNVGNNRTKGCVCSIGQINGFLQVLIESTAVVDTGTVAVSGVPNATRPPKG